MRTNKPAPRAARLHALMTLLLLGCPCFASVCVAQRPLPPRPNPAASTMQAPSTMEDNSVCLYNATQSPLAIIVAFGSASQSKTVLGAGRKSYIAIPNGVKSPVKFVVEMTVKGRPTPLQLKRSFEEGAFYQIYYSEGKLLANIVSTP